MRRDPGGQDAACSGVEQLGTAPAGATHSRLVVFKMQPAPGWSMKEVPQLVQHKAGSWGQGCSQHLGFSAWSKASRPSSSEAQDPWSQLTPHPRVSGGQV